jgi:hypothetical protein
MQSHGLIKEERMEKAMAKANIKEKEKVKAKKKENVKEIGKEKEKMEVKARKARTKEEAKGKAKTKEKEKAKATKAKDTEVTGVTAEMHMLQPEVHRTQTCVSNTKLELVRQVHAQMGDSIGDRKMNGNNGKSAVHNPILSSRWLPLQPRERNPNHPNRAKNGD